MVHSPETYEALQVGTLRKLRGSYHDGLLPACPSRTGSRRGNQP